VPVTQESDASDVELDAENVGELPTGLPPFKTPARTRVRFARGEPTAGTIPTCG
jgi:hypothetical protein